MKNCVSHISKWRGARNYLPLLILALAAGCATPDTGRPAPRDAQTDTAPSPDRHIPTPAAARDLAEVSGPTGMLDIDITDVLGRHLPARIDLLDFADNPPFVLEVPEGRLEAQVPAGDYRAYVHVYEQGVPILVEIKDLRVRAEREAYILVELLEGASEILSLHDFDSDGDLAIDRVELDAGTNPYDASSIPGRAQLPYESRVLQAKPGWYRGELFAYSNHSIGEESVAQLVRRAERAGLDFLAITDLHSVGALYDPGFQSNSVVLIPAMSWGDGARGAALIYGMRTLPDMPSTQPAAQAECIRVQAQGGIFAIAHPAFVAAPWQWALSYVNAVQVWTRGWRDLPPLAVADLDEDTRFRFEGRYVHSIAAAAQLAEGGDIGGNAQAERFYDFELVRGLMAAAIGGSGATDARTPLGRPITYVYAEEKSLDGIIEGLRLGRTYVSSGPDGPRLYMSADITNNGQIDVGIGGVVPLNVDVMFEVGVFDAMGKKLQVLLNGRPIITKIIEGDSFIHRFMQHQHHYGVYRVRVISPAEDPGGGFGPIEVHAVSSPIYAQEITREIMWQSPELIDRSWIRIERDPTPEVQLPEHLPPMQVPMLTP